MQGLMDKFYRFCLTAVKVLSLLLAFFLFAGCLLFTSYSTDMSSQTVLFRLDHPLQGLLSVAVYGVLFWGVTRTKNPRPNRLMALVLFWVCAIGGILIVFGKTVPAADAYSVYSAAGELANGQTTFLRPEDSYFSYYPHQIGLTAFFELLIRFWNLLPISEHAYHFIKCTNVLFACVIVFFQKETVHLLWKNNRIDCIYLLLAGFNLPFIMYTSFVYGEIPSYAFFSAGIYFLLKFLRADTRSAHFCFGAAATALLSASVALRKNNLIFIIAILIVIFLLFLKSRKLYQLLFLFLCALCAFGILPGIQKIYELRSGYHLPSGVPPISYLAMGMQDESNTRCAGWYNGFNFYTYQDTGMDTEASTAISLEVIRERAACFKEKPVYAMGFYFRKHLSQWADGTYASRQATLATFGGRHDFFRSLYEGAYSSLFIEYGNLYQNILYLGLFLFCIFQCRSRSSSKEKTDTYEGQNKDSAEGLPLWMGMLGIIGGFLFHIAWEANSRYILLYSLTMMPYSACGIYGILKWLQTRHSLTQNVSAE